MITMPMIGRLLYLLGSVCFFVGTLCTMYEETP